MTKDEMLNTLLGLADKAKQTGDADKAKDIYQRIIKNSPDSDQALIAQDALDTLESLSKPRKPPLKKAPTSTKNIMEYVYLGSVLNYANQIREAARYSIA